MAESPPPLDPEDFLRRVVEAGRNVKFGRGVVGKTSHAVIGLIGLWLIIVVRLGTNLTADAVLLGAGCIITGMVAWWIKATQRFAADNPAQAMLEGAELIEYQRVEAEAKGGFRSSGPLIAEDAPVRLLGQGEP